MIRRMLINAVHSEECRVAISEDDRLLELEIERADQTQMRGNIYKASISRIEPSLQAAFLDIGSSRNGFLQINDIHSAYFNNWPPENQNARYRPSIQEVLRAHQDLIVQVVKDERDAKGATLTTNISIPGKFLVLMIGNQRGGVSRKINDESQRSRLKHAVDSLRVPAGMGVIVRTAGINKSSIELQRDLDSLLDIWYSVVEKSYTTGSPQLLYQESDLAIRTIRDSLSSDVDEVIIDDHETYQRSVRFVEKIMPNLVSRLKFYNEPRPLFARYHLDTQVQATGQPEVTLPSGGSIVFGITEAVVAVDVNSGRSTGQSDVEETAFNTNREAANAIATQLRLRDLGGLVVIDFIDMNDRRHKAIIEKTMRDAVRTDRAKIELGKISKFGLLEMSRQRLRSSLASHSEVPCPHCHGKGRVRTPESAAIEALRKIQSAAFAGGVSEVRVRMAPGPALLLLNDKRKILSKIEEDTQASVLIYADGRMKSEEYELEIVTANQNKKENLEAPREGSRSEHSSPAINQRGTRSSPPSSARDNDNNGSDGRPRKRRRRRPKRRDYGNQYEPQQDSDQDSQNDSQMGLESDQADPIVEPKGDYQEPILAQSEE